MNSSFVLLTTEELRACGCSLEKDLWPGLEGVWSIKPPLKVLAHEDGYFIQKGKVYTATHFDENGKHPGTLHVLEAGMWWKIGMFSLA